MTSDPKTLDDAALDILFREARTYNGWLDKEVSDELLKEVYELTKWGPTSANCCPMRVVFVKSQEAKERLKPHLSEGNVEKTMAAPVTAIIGDDKKFYEELPTLFSHADAKSWFVGKPDLIEETAFRNGCLQGAYLMLAARALGLDCGPMSGFDSVGVTKEFFEGTEVEANFLVNLGYGDEESLYLRGPRMRFEEVCKVL